MTPITKSEPLQIPLPFFTRLCAGLRETAAMIRAGRRLEGLLRQSEAALAAKGYDRETLLWQVCREEGVAFEGAER